MRYGVVACLTVVAAVGCSCGRSHLAGSTDDGGGGGVGPDSGRWADAAVEVEPDGSAGTDAGAPYDASVATLDPTGDAGPPEPGDWEWACNPSTVFIPMGDSTCVVREVAGAESRECPDGSGQAVTVLNRIEKQLEIAVSVLDSGGCRADGCVRVGLDTAESCDCGGFLELPGAAGSAAPIVVHQISRFSRAFSMTLGGAGVTFLVRVCMVEEG